MYVNWDLQLLLSVCKAPMYTANPAMDNTATRTKKDAIAKAMEHIRPLDFPSL